MLARTWASQVAAAAVAVLITCSLAVPAAEAEKAGQKKQRPVEIVAPEDEDAVMQIEDVQGRMKPGAGWPVVLVRPCLGGDPWYCQHPVDAVEDDGAFTTQAHFGNEATEPGTMFRLVAVVARDRQEASRFKPGMTLKTLPAGRPRSAYVVVERQ